MEISKITTQNGDKENYAFLKSINFSCPPVENSFHSHAPLALAKF